MLTKEEKDVLHHFVLLSVARKALELDLTILEQSSLKLRNPYCSLIYDVLDDVSKELAILKRYMHEKQLTIVKVGNDGIFSKYEFICRGFQSTHHYLNTHLKNQVFSYMNNCFSTRKSNVKQNKKK